MHSLLSSTLTSIFLCGLLSTLSDNSFASVLRFKWKPFCYRPITTTVMFDVRAGVVLRQSPYWYFWAPDWGYSNWNGSLLHRANVDYTILGLHIDHLLLLELGDMRKKCWNVIDNRVKLANLDPNSQLKQAVNWYCTFCQGRKLAAIMAGGNVSSTLDLQGQLNTSDNNGKRFYYYEASAAIWCDLVYYLWKLH